MAKQTINIGTIANDGTGSTLRAAGDLINDNFNEIYTSFGDGSTLGTGYITAVSSDTLQNKGISLASNTITGTTAEFNTALSDGSFATLAGSETLTNKILTSPVIANITSTADIDLTATDDVNVPANVGLTFGDDGEKIEGDGTNLAIYSSNAFSVNATNSIFLTSPQPILFRTGSTNYGSVTNSTSDFVIASEVQDKDIIFKGDDNGSTITALTLDMSEAGNAIFNSGATFSGNVIVSDPTLGSHAATKSYVDTIAAAGIHYHTAVRVESPTNLNAAYNNGTSGVGATLTNSGTLAAISIDGVTLSLNDRVLVYNQTNAAHNGIYYVSTVGDGATAWVLTRTTDTDSYGASDPNALGEGDAFFVKEGDTGAGELYVMNTSGTITFGTTNITFTVIAETAVYSAGTALTLTGTTFSVTPSSISSTQLASAVSLQILDSSGTVVKTIYGAGS